MPFEIVCSDGRTVIGLATDLMYLQKKIDYFQKYGIILLVVSPTAKWTAKSVSNSNGVTTRMAMWKRIAIFTRRNMQTDFKLYKVDMKYIRNLHNIDDKVLSVSPQTGKDNRVFVGIVIICGIHKYCIPLSSPKEKHKKMKNSMDFSKIEINGRLLGVLNFPRLESECEKYNSKIKRGAD